MTVTELTDTCHRFDVTDLTVTELTLSPIWIVTDLTATQKWWCAVFRHSLQYLWPISPMQCFYSVQTEIVTNGHVSCI